jgi:hypothetical protein
VLQGDVFAGVAVPNTGVEHEYAMIIAHPCNMRTGAVLRPKMKMIPVTAHEHIPFERWSRVVRVFPLPDMLGDGKNFAARFDDVGMVDSENLTVSSRVCSLTDRGILMLQQRYVYSDTRALIEMSTLGEAAAAVLAEAELLEQWNERLVLPSGIEGLEFEELLAEQARLFDDFLSRPVEGSIALRGMLQDEHRRAFVRRSVREEIGRRAEQASNA